MDYVKKLDKSIENFEREAGKLAQIVALVDEAAKLIAEIRAGKDVMQKSSARLAEMQRQIAADCQTLATFSANEKAARQKLLKEIRALVTEDTARAVEKLLQPLNTAHENLTRTAGTFAKSVADENALHRKFIDNMSVAATQNAEANENFRARISENLAEHIRAETAARQDFSSDIQATFKNFVDNVSAVTDRNAEANENFRARISENLAEHIRAETAARQDFSSDIQATFENFVDNVSAVTDRNAEANENFRARISENLAEYIRAETAARQKLVADIHDTVAGDAKKIVDEISAPLNQVNAELAKTCAQIGEFIETHKKSQAAFLAEIEALLIRYNAKNIEVYNSITGVVTNRLDVAQNSVETQLAKQNAAAETQALELNNKIQALSNAVQNFSSNLSVHLNYIKIAVTIAMGTGIISCAAQFLFR